MSSNELIASADGKCEYHQADHSFRVMYFARKIFDQQLKIEAPEYVKENPEIIRQALDWAAVLHDREMRGKNDFTHGERVAVKVDEIVGQGVSEDCRILIKFLCLNHVPDDSELSYGYWFTPTQWWTLKVFKDADSLDRVRFGDENTLNEQHLRFNETATLIAEARELREKTGKGFASPQEAFDAIFGNTVE